MSGYYLPPHKWYHCYSTEDSHPWRKPNPGMIEAAAKNLDIDKKRSAMFGDSWTDLEAAKKAKIQFFPVDPYKGPFLLHQVQSFLESFNKDAEQPTIH